MSNKYPERIQPQLRNLWDLLFDLKEMNQNYEFWYKLDIALKNYLKVDLGDVDTDDALNLLEIEIYKNPDKFTPFRDDVDSFVQKVALLRLAFNNHVLKVHRSDIAEQIRVLRYKELNYGLNQDEQEELKHLIEIKSKL
jgi:hypothetical protein